MPDGIEIRRGIHHPSIREHQVKALRSGVAGDKTGECQGSEEAEDRCHADVIAVSVRRDNAAIEEDAQKRVFHPGLRRGLRFLEAYASD